MNLPGPDNKSAPSIEVLDQLADAGHAVFEARALVEATKRRHAEELSEVTAKHHAALSALALLQSALRAAPPLVEDVPESEPADSEADPEETDSEEVVPNNTSGTIAKRLAEMLRVNPKLTAAEAAAALYPNEDPAVARRRIYAQTDYIKGKKVWVRRGGTGPFHVDEVAFRKAWPAEEDP